MPAVHDTAYPHLRSTITWDELHTLYTPTVAEQTLAAQVTRGGRARLAFLVLLKTFQRLGYFVLLADVPRPIVRHIAHTVGSHTTPEALAAYDTSGTRQRHRAVIRAHLQIQPWSRDGRRMVVRAVADAVQTKSDLADLINVALEELVRQRVELPAFSTLHRAAGHVRAVVHRAM